MPRWITASLLTVLVFGWLPSSHAQQGDMEYFASFEGLNRVIARSWAAPLQDITPDDAGTPAATPQPSTPVASPVGPAPVGVSSISVFVYLFDSDDHAAAGFSRIDSGLQKTVLRDPQAPMTEDIPLDDVGDDARGYMGEMTMDGLTTEYTFATVQDGPFVYSLSGMFSGADGAALAREYALQIIDTRMDRMAEQYHQDGSSSGGLWSKLNGIQPDMPESSTAVDFIIYPMPESTPEATPVL